MDWHKLQHKLFEMDPTDPREDLRKLREQAEKQKNVAPTINYLVETVNVPKGSLPINGLDLEGFAKLAGITLNETQKTGPAGQAKGSDPMPKAKAGRTEHPLKDKLVGEEEIEEKKNPEPPKQRNPVAAYAQKSGAGVHKDQNKKNIPLRKEKHKSKSMQYESIKDRLWDALNRNK